MKSPQRVALAVLAFAAVVAFSAVKAYCQETTPILDLTGTIVIPGSDN
jgi:hypothetical protein